MKKAIIIGATSGIGLEVARLFIGKGWRIGIAGRREEALKRLRAEAPAQVEMQALDVTCDNATALLTGLIERVGGMDVFLHCAGIGHQNPTLDPDIEINTARTNVEGFIRLTTFAFRYFEAHSPMKGHIAVISSIAGTKGMGAAPAYSATKRFQNTYIDALEQLACMKGLHLCFTDIRPGFVDTPLLKGKNYPMLMQPTRVARSIVKAIEQRKRVVIIDGRYRLLVFFWRLLPRLLWKRMNIKN